MNVFVRRWLRGSLAAPLGALLACSCSGSAPSTGADAAIAVDASAASVDTADASSVDAAIAGAVLRWPRSPAAAIAVAATNDSLAIAYVERVSGTGGASEARLLLQQLDADLDARGAAQELDRQPIGSAAPAPSVATDGANFLVCWSPQDRIRCLAPAGGGGSSPFFQTTGVSPTVVFHGNSWALAYVASASRSQMNEARVVRISSEGTQLGAPAAFLYDAYFSVPPPFVATPSGFALLAGQPKLSLYRLTAELAIKGTPVDIGLSPWAFQTLAATDDEAAMGLAVPYGNTLVHVRGSEIVLHQERGCASKVGCDTAVAVQGDTFAVAWWSTSGEFSFFADIDHAGASQDVLAIDPSSIALVPFRSRLVAVSKDAP